MKVETSKRISKVGVYLCDKQGRKELKPLFMAAKKAQEEGKPGMILAQVRKDHTGDGVFMDVHFLPHEQGVRLNAFIKEMLVKEEEGV